MSLCRVGGGLHGVGACLSFVQGSEEEEVCKEALELFSIEGIFEEEQLRLILLLSRCLSLSPSYYLGEACAWLVLEK